MSSRAKMIILWKICFLKQQKNVCFIMEGLKLQHTKIIVTYFFHQDHWSKCVNNHAVRADQIGPQ